MRYVLAVALAAALAACGGEEGPRLAGPPIDPGHGSVEEVTKALADQGVPCASQKPLPLPAGTEQALECTLQDESVQLVHFLSPEAATAYEQALRAEDAHGVYAETWAARTETAMTAEVISRAVKNRGRS